MTQPPPGTSGEPADPPADHPFVLPPAPPPMAPWWASSSLDSEPPDPLDPSADAPVTAVEPIPARPEPPRAETTPAAPPATGPRPVVTDPHGVSGGRGAAGVQARAAETGASSGPQAVIIDPSVGADPRAATGLQGVSGDRPSGSGVLLAERGVGEGAGERSAEGGGAGVRPRPAGKGKGRRSKPRVVAGLAVGAGVLATTVVGGLVVAGGSGADVPVRRVSAPAVAGGLQKDGTLPAASAAYPFIAAAARAGGVEKAATATAVYRGADEDGRSVLFLGGTAPVGDPVGFLGKARPSTVIETAGTTSLKGGGKLSCGTFAVLAATHPYCAWATENSFGFVAAEDPSEGGAPDTLAALTERMRADLEKTLEAP